MAYPDKPSLDYSYTGFQQSQGDNSFPGSQVDNDLANIKDSLDGTIDFIKGAINSDGSLKVAAFPDMADLTAYVSTASSAATAASASSSSSASSASIASAAAVTASAAAASINPSTLMLKANNLSDLANASAARTNLGLGTAATTAATAYATAAQGAKADSALQTVPVGSVVQVVNSTTGATATGTTTIPFDDTIPQNTEGDQYMSATITPTNVNNKLKIEVVWYGTNSATGRLCAALFQDSAASALACGFEFIDAAVANRSIVFTYYMTAGTTSATTFKVRAGNHNAGTTYFNGSSTGRLYGGVLASSITITEIKG